MLLSDVMGPRSLFEDECNFQLNAVFPDLWGVIQFEMVLLFLMFDWVSGRFDLVHTDFPTEYFLTL